MGGALPGLGNVDALFAQTATAILSSGVATSFEAPSIDRAADAERAREQVRAPTHTNPS